MADPEALACQQFVELVTDYLEDAMDRAARRRFEAHLAECDGCEAYLEQIRATVAAAGSLRDAPLPGATRAALLGLFRAWSRTLPG